MKTLFTILLILIGGLVSGAIIFINKKRVKFTHKPYKPLEHALIEELLTLFLSEAKQVIKDQLVYLEKRRKWRQFWEKSMSLELYGSYNDQHDASFYLPRKEDSTIAIIKFQAAGKQYKARFETHQGVIWGWRITPNPQGIMHFSDIKIINKSIKDDPLKVVELPKPAEKLIPVPNFTGLLGELQNRFVIESANIPLQPREIEKLQNQLLTKLPVEYLGIVKQVEGVVFEDFIISGISGIQLLPVDDLSLYQLVEFHDGFLGVLENDLSGNIYSISFSERMPEDLGNDFDSILLNRINKIVP